jgi:2-phospho-L-lactate guanylyltransferase (CobY/MobA/RfbA family)
VVPVKALGAAKSRLSAVLGEGERAALALWLLGRVVAAIGTSGEVADVAVVSPDEAALGRARAEGAVALRQIEGDLGAAIEQGRRWAIGLGAEALLVALGDLPLLTGENVREMIALALPPASHPGGDGGRDSPRSPIPSMSPLWVDGGPLPRPLPVAQRRGEGSSVPPVPRTGEGSASPVPRKGRGAGGLGLVVLAPDRAGTGTNVLLLRPPGSMPFAFGAGSYARHVALARRYGVTVATYRAAGTAFDVDGRADLAELRAGELWPLVGGRAVQG